MKLHWGHEDLVVPFVMGEIGQARPFGKCRTAVVLSATGNLAAGLVFHNFYPEGGVIEVSAAAIDPRWAQRGVLVEAFGYVFGRGQCQLAVARTAPDNTRTRRLWRSFGADEYVIPRLRGAQTAEVILTLTDDAWASSRYMR